MSASNGVKNNFRASIVVICFALALAIGVIRYLTGPEWALSALYLFPIILVTWKAGIGAGIFISITSAISWLIADLMMVNVFSNAIIPCLNETFRLLVFLVITLTTTAKLQPLAFEQAGPFFYDATCKPLDCAVNGIQ